MVRFANVLALSLVLVGLSTSASPVINEQRDIERRTTSLSCGWAKKDGVDMGCMCKMPGLNLGIDLGGLNILDLGLKQYPPGCKPTCDDKVYECPYGKNGKGGCNEPHPCPPNQCESYGKCCPYGTINMQGTCCPKGCQVKEGQCYVPHPEPEPVPQCGENADYSKHEKKCVCKKGYEMFDYKCVKECGKDMYRNKEGHCVCNNHELKPDDKGVCRPQCHPPKILDPHKNMCKCPDHLVDDKKGGCMTPPPKCYEPKKLNHEKTACVCPEHLDDDGKGGCKPKPPVCHEPKKLNHEKTACVCPEHLDDDGKGGCKPKPPVCHEPKKLNHEKTACVCPEHLEDDGKGGCKAKPPMCKGGKKPDHYGNCVCPEHQMEDKHGKCFTPATCHYPYVQSHDKMSCVCGPDYDTKHDGSCKKKEEKPKPKPCGPGKKWCSTQCCRDDQEEKNGRCGCPSGYKEIPFLNTCEKLSILGINL